MATFNDEMKGQYFVKLLQLKNTQLTKYALRKFIHFREKKKILPTNYDFKKNIYTGLCNHNRI